MTATRDDFDVEPGDLVLVELGPTRGSEQNGRRPALVVSAAPMNRQTKRVIVCPITSNTDPWPTKVQLPPGLGVSGVVLTDQVRSIDQKARILRKLGRPPETVLFEVRYQLLRLIGL